MNEAHVFLSFAHEDRTFVDDLAERLKAAGVAVWYERDLTPGRPWSAELEGLIRAAQAVAVALSPASAGSEHVRKEIHFAKGAGKSFIPVLLRPVEVPLPLAGLKWVDAQPGQDPLPGLLAALRGVAAPDLKPPEVLPSPPPPLEAEAARSPDLLRDLAGQGEPDEGEFDESEADEIVIDYSYMERACAAAANAPPMVLREEDRQAYAGLGHYTYTLDIDYEEEV